MNSLMCPQVCVFTDLCLSLNTVFTALLEEHVTFVGGMAFGFYAQPTPKKLPRMQCARAIPVA